MFTMRLILAVLVSFVCCAETRFYVDQRGDYSSGREFGSAGVYELITAKVVTGSGQGQAEVLKPRDPAKGNHTFLLDVNGKRSPAPDTFLSGGTTLIRLRWSDKQTLAAGVKEILEFLKYQGGPMLLGDQSRFLRRAVVVDDGQWVAEFLKAGNNKDEKGRPLLDASLRSGDAKSMDVSKAQPLQQ